MEHNFTWREVSPGKYLQPLGHVDHVFGTLPIRQGERQQWIVYSGTSFETSLTDNALLTSLKTAWKHSRYAFPTLACLADDKNKTYKVPKNEEELDKWVDESFVVHMDSSSKEQVPKLRAEHLLVLIHYFPHRRELLLQADHRLVDTRGLCMFWDRFFTLVAQPPTTAIEFGSEVRNLPPSLDDILNFAASPGAEDMQLAQAAVAEMMVPDLIDMPVANMDDPPADSNYCAVKLSSALTKAVVAACRQHNVSVTVAFYAAVILATRQSQVEAKGKSGSVFSSFHTYDVRQYFPKDLDTRRYTICDYSPPFVMTNKSTTFDGLVKELKASYAKLLADPPTADSLISLECAFTHIVREVFAAVGGLPKSSTPLVVSSGVLENYMLRSHGEGERRITVSDLFVNVYILSAQIQPYLWTYNDQLTIHLGYNEAYYTQAEVRKYGKLIQSILLGELGVEEA
jgi:hypothetical protein